MKFKDLQKLKKQMKEQPASDPDSSKVAAAKAAGDKLKTSIKSAETVLKPVED